MLKKITALTAAPAGWEVEIQREIHYSGAQDVSVEKTYHPVVAWAVTETVDENEPTEHDTEPMVHTCEWGIVTLSELQHLERFSFILVWDFQVLFNGAPPRREERSRPLSDYDVEKMCEKAVSALRAKNKAAAPTDEQIAKRIGLPVERVSAVRAKVQGSAKR